MKVLGDLILMRRDVLPIFDKRISALNLALIGGVDIEDIEMDLVLALKQGLCLIRVQIGPAMGEGALGCARKEEEGNEQ